MKAIKILAKVLLSLLGLVGLALLVLLCMVWFSKPRPQLEFQDPYQTERSTLEAESYAVVSGTPWATEAAANVLENGGNAVDAAVAGVLMLNVTFGEAASFPGVAPTMYYDAASKEVKSYIGAGTAPELATIEAFKDRGHDKVPSLNILAQLLPASPDVMIRLLQEHGSMSFSELVKPAIDRARTGFPVHHTMAKNLGLSLIERVGFRFLLPSSSEVYFGEKWWLPLKEKDHFKRPMLANTLDALAHAEQEALAQGKSREEALQAVRDYFYQGPIAQKIAEYHEKKNGLIRLEDLANYKGDWEQPLEGQFNEYTIFVNGTWSQGIVIPMVLQVLEGLDLKSMGHNSEAYIHHLVQAIDLTMADREAFVADSQVEEVPLETLLSKNYATTRRKAISAKAFSEMPPSGDAGTNKLSSSRPPKPQKTSKPAKGNMLKVGDDTSQIVVVDSSGNAIAITPSDFPMSPLIPGTGLTMGIRMTQFQLDADHINRLKPGKRPRITPHAAIVFKNGEFFMAFNTPGGDMQTQALVQVFLNLVVFDMDIQEAINAPRIRSKNFPSSFDPDDYSPGVLSIEESLYQELATDLELLGYELEPYPDWDNQFSAVGAILLEDGKLHAGIDPRESGTAIGK